MCGPWACVSGRVESFDHEIADLLRCSMGVEYLGNLCPLVVMVGMECSNGGDFRRCEWVAVYLGVETVPTLTAGAIVATIADVMRYCNPVGTVLDYCGVETRIFERGP